MSWYLLLLLTTGWPQFRGPNGSGVADRAAPVEFGSEKNVIWVTPLPPGASSPVISGDRIFLTASEGDQLLTIAIDRATGKLLWKQPSERPRREPFQPTHGPASPSPATDGQNVYVFFGDFGLISYDRNGRERWKLPLGPFNNANGHGSSPIVADGMVVLICDQDEGSYLLAVDSQTGKVRWKTERPEVTRGYATPAVYRPRNGPAELVVPGSFHVAGYELATGKKLWWVNGFGWQAKSVPLIDGDTVYVNVWEAGGDSDSPPETETFEEKLAKFDSNKDGVLSAQEIPEARSAHWFAESDLNDDKVLDRRDWDFYRARRFSQNNVVAIRGGGRGEITKTHVLWRYRKSLPNVPSPLLYQGVLFLVKEGGIVTTLDPKSGEVLKQARLSGALGQYWASPVAAAGRVYATSAQGKISVLTAKPQWEVVAVNDLAEDVLATPAIVDGRLYVRTAGRLYCFGSK